MFKTKSFCKLPQMIMVYVIRENDFIQQRYTLIDKWSFYISMFFLVYVFYDTIQGKWFWDKMFRILFLSFFRG